MLLHGKKLLITGVLTPQSIAFAVAELALKEGAELLLTSFGRPMSLTQRTAKRLSSSVEVLELDVTNPAHFSALHDSVKARWGRIDGALHAIAFAPEDALGGKFTSTPWESVQQAFRISTFSLKELAVALTPLFDRGGSIVTLDFDNSTQAWPLYDWMGVCKAGLEATVRYLARDLGPKKIRVNALAAVDRAHAAGGDAANQPVLAEVEGVLGCGCHGQANIVHPQGLHSGDRGWHKAGHGDGSPGLAGLRLAHRQP